VTSRPGMAPRSYPEMKSGPYSTYLRVTYGPTVIDTHHVPYTNPGPAIYGPILFFSTSKHLDVQRCVAGGVSPSSQPDGPRPTLRRSASTSDSHRLNKRGTFASLFEHNDEATQKYFRRSGLLLGTDIFAIVHCTFNLAATRSLIFDLPCHDRFRACTLSICSIESNLEDATQSRRSLTRAQSGSRDQARSSSLALLQLTVGYDRVLRLKKTMPATEYGTVRELWLCRNA
jgi:hypothetical protein